MEAPAGFPSTAGGKIHASGRASAANTPEPSPNACPRLRGGIEKIAAEHGLSAGDTAMALAYAIALLIAQTKDVLPAAVAATLALEVMTGVSRMVPMKQPL